MSTLNVKIPDEMEDDLQYFLEEHPYYLNKSELVRDAVRHLIESSGLSDRAREDIQTSREQIEAGQTISLEDLE
jgi:Arc/MetJ-type ribon-helix-helix transcriptional regulator